MKKDSPWYKSIKKALGMFSGAMSEHTVRRLTGPRLESRPMKALVLSGGAGTRLRPITHTSAKQLVPVANKPILFYVLDDIAEAGVTETGIVVGETGDEIREAVGDGSAWGLKVTYIDQDEPRGLAHTVLIAREFLGEDPFVMYLGDNMLRDGIGSFVRRFEGSGCAVQIMVTPVEEPQWYGVVELDGE